MFEHAHIFLFSHGEVSYDGAVLGAEATLESPVADCDFFNKHFLYGALRLDIVDEFIVELSESERVFASFPVVDDHFLCPESVSDGVLCRGSFAFRGLWSGGELGILAIGL